MIFSCMKSKVSSSKLKNSGCSLSMCTPKAPPLSWEESFEDDEDDDEENSTILDRMVTISGKYRKMKGKRDGRDWFVKPKGNNLHQDAPVRLFYSKAMKDHHVSGGGRWVLRMAQWTLGHHEPQENDTLPEGLDPDAWNFDDLEDAGLSIHILRDENDKNETVIEIEATLSADFGEEKEDDFEQSLSAVSPRDPIPKVELQSNMRSFKQTGHHRNHRRHGHVGPHRH